MRPTLCLGRPMRMALAVGVVASVSVGQQTSRVSVDSSGVQGNGLSVLAAISGDGRFVLFGSDASKLVPNDTNGARDAFVRDLTTGLTERVSVDSSGAQGNGSSDGAAISPDGRFVAFDSYASNLVAGDTNKSADAFLRDRSTGITERISVDSSGVQGNAASFAAAISADGRFVAFTSYASNLVAGDSNGRVDAFIRDRSTGITECVSVDSSGAEGDDVSYAGAISADGLIVSFSSFASNFVANDSNLTSDVFVHDRSTGRTELVSVDSSGTQGNDFSYLGSASADARVVAFYSASSNLVAGDTNTSFDAFVHDRTTGLTERVSVASSGAAGNGDSYAPAISDDGQVVAFMSYASNLVTGDTNATSDVFVHRRATGVTERVSVDSFGAQANDYSNDRSISADGQVVAFNSAATNLVAGDTNGCLDVFVYERCPVGAAWSNYGNGFPGTFGVPSLTSKQNPVIGTTITLDLANSWQQPTVGLLFVGFQRANLHSGFGGDLLVVPSITQLITFSYGSNQFSGDIPDDAALCGSTIDVQAVEADPGAAKGVSFTPGLELVFGR